MTSTEDRHWHGMYIARTRGRATECALAPGVARALWVSSSFPSSWARGNGHGGTAVPSESRSHGPSRRGGLGLELKLLTGSAVSLGDSDSESCRLVGHAPSQ